MFKEVFNKVLFDHELSNILSKNALKSIDANFSINKMVNDEYDDLTELSE